MDALESILSTAEPISDDPDDSPWADDAERVVLESLARCWTPRAKEKTEDWLFKNIRLTEGQTAEYSGEPWDVNRVPHARIIFDFLADPYAEELSIMKSSAAGLSTATIAALVYRLWDDPCNILYLITNREEATKLAKQVWKPFLRQVFGGAVMDREDQSNLHLQVAGVQIYSGSPTESLLRNKQVGILVEDESDTMEDDLIGGANNLETAQRERTKNTRGRKIIRLCTPLYAYDQNKPKIKQPRTRIHRNYLMGDQREYRCPCPSCGHEKAILEEDLFFPDCCKLFDESFDLDAIRETTFWRCSLCRHEVHDNSAEKRAMIQAGHWVGTVKAASRRFWSARHTDLVALIGSVSWGFILSELKRTEGTAENSAVRRSHLAEPEALTAIESGGRDRAQILRHCEHYTRGTCPVIPWQVAIVSDVQRDRPAEKEFGGIHLRFPWMIAAISREPAGDIWVLNWGEGRDFDDLYLCDRSGRVHGLFAQSIPLALAPGVWDRAFPSRPQPPAVWPKRGLIDSGFRARGAVQNEDEAAEESVYAFCLRTWSHAEGRFRFLPVKGRAGRQIQGLTIDTLRPVRGIQLPLHHYDDWAFKSDLNLRLVSDPQNPSALARQRPRIHFPRESEIDEAFLDHLTSERLVEKEIKGRTGRVETVKQWDAAGANDWWDCLKWFLVLNELLRKKAVSDAASGAA